MQTKRAGIEVAGGLQSLVQSGSLVGLCEEELLARFIEGKDARAFKAIIDRHGPVVLAVCRHLLSDPNDLEDAFQATFLILIRKGGTIRRPASLASWLHGVAHRTAARLRRSPRTIRLMTDPAERPLPCPVENREQIGHLHREIERLPEKYRLPIVLCYLQGLTYDDAAAQLRWPVSTVRGRPSSCGSPTLPQYGPLVHLFGAGLRPHRGGVTRRPSVALVARSGDLAPTWGPWREPWDH